MSHPPVILTPASTIDALLGADIERAETLLHALAVELSCHRHTGHGAPLHVRALALKRDVARWKELAPSEPRRRAAIDEILALYESAKGQRGRRH